VQAKVANDSYILARFIEAQHRMLYDHRNDIIWTEGFSVRTKVAFAAGLFPEDIPGCSGEDAVFGENLEKNFKKTIDRSIIVPHVAPHKFKEFWKQRVGRGRGTPYRMFYVNKLPLKNTIRNYLIGNMVTTAIGIFTILPMLYLGFKMSKFSKYKLLDAIPFAIISTIDYIGYRYGEIKGYREIKRKLKG
jgi:hypothetical protein